MFDVDVVSAAGAVAYVSHEFGDDESTFRVGWMERRVSEVEVGVELLLVY